MYQLQLDLNFHTGGQIQRHQCLNGLGRGIGDVDQSLVRAALELLTAVLILVGGTQDGDDLLLGGQRDGAGHGSAGALGGLNNLLCALVDDLVVIGLQANANHFFCHLVCSSIFVRFVLLDQLPYGEKFFIRCSVRIIPAHKKHRHRLAGALLAQRSTLT